MKKFSYVLWVWFSTAAFAGFIYWLSVVWSNQTLSFTAATVPTDEALKVIFRMILYAILFILFYRAVIVTLRNTVRRLSSWHSRREAVEDAEFTLLVETLVVVVAILFSILFAVLEEFAQNFSIIFGSSTQLVQQTVFLEMQRDILVSTMAALLTALIVYSVPAIGELEVAIKEKISREYNHYRSKDRK